VRRPFGGFGANLWAWRFLGRLRREVDRALPGRGQALAARVRDAARAVWEAEREGMVDAQAGAIVATCALALAADRLLAAELADPRDARALLRRAFLGTWRAPARLGTWIAIRLVPRPATVVSRFPFARFMRWTYGAGMQTRWERRPAGGDLVVSRCAFHQFFAAHGAPELTALVCEWDRAWMDVLDAAPAAIRTSRPTTIASGGAECLFRFVSDAAPKPAPPSDVVLSSARNQVTGRDGA
jgi:hypothetical protein